MDDVVQRGITVTRDGESMWPPPPVPVSAAPPKADAAPVVVAEPKAPMSPAKKVGRARRNPCYSAGFSRYRRSPLPQHFTVLMLAIVIGYYVIGNVAHALHAADVGDQRDLRRRHRRRPLQIAVGTIENATTIRILSAIAILVALSTSSVASR